MTDDPIVEEVHRVREELLAECGGDLKKLFEQIRRRTEEAARAGRTVVSLPPGLVNEVATNERKAG